MFLDKILGKSSVEVRKTTQGVTYGVKVYHLNPEKAKTVANDIFSELQDIHG